MYPEKLTPTILTLFMSPWPRPFPSSQSSLRHLRMIDNILPLSSDFDTATEADWLEAVSKALKGRDISTLSHRTTGGLDIKPLYRESDFPAASDPLGAPGAAPYLRGGQTQRDKHLPWDIRQIFTHPDPAVTNAEILYDLERGVSSVEIRLDPTGKTGCAITSLEDFQSVLGGVHADLATIALEHGAGTGTTAAALLALWADTQNNPKAQRLAFNIDPLGALARTGHLKGGLETAFERLAAIFPALSLRFPSSTILRIDARAIHESGGSEAQELAALIASAIDTLRRLQSAGLAPEDAAGKMGFALALDANYGIGIAKLQAARRLWARIQETLNITPQPMQIQAVSSARMLTRYDPWVNMLRGTAACFAGAAGGADIISIRPFNAALGIPESLGRRIARNTQIIAMEESGLGRVADPAGGAWAMAALASEMAQAAWNEMQNIEKEGGYGASLLSGKFQSRIAEARQSLMQNIAMRKAPITGVSAFPLLDSVDAPVADSQLKAGAGSISAHGIAALIPDFIAQPGKDAQAEPLAPIRLAQPFEDLRDRAEAHLARYDKRPSLFLATLGPVAEHNARADFTRNFFAAGGIEALSAPVPPETTAECAAAFKASGCDLAVICGSDTRYETDAETLAAALKEAGALRIYLAGKMAAPGIDTNIFTGCDRIHILKLTLAELGVK